MANQRRTSDASQRKEKKEGRRSFLKVALGAAGAVVAAAIGLILLKRPSKQTSVTPPVTAVTPPGTAVTPPEGKQGAQLALLNGKIITVDSNDSIAQAVAVEDGRITRVGTNEEVKAFIGDSTQVIDLKGKTVTPGLIDSHCHIGGGYQEKYDYLDLRPGKVNSIDDIVRLVAHRVEETPKGEWVLGFGWFPAYWSQSRLPTRFDLDRVSPDNPVFLTDISGWYGWVNSYALNLSGVDENTPNPSGGIIDKDRTSNKPTGLLINHAAMWLVKKPTPSQEQLEEGVRYASGQFAKEGVTRIEDNWVKGKDLLGAYQALNGRGEPPSSVDVYYHINSEAEAEAAVQALPSVKRGFGGRVCLKGWKLQVDGAAATAYTYEPHNGYAHDVASLNPETLKKIVSILHKSGLQLSIHVLGDRALDTALDAIEAALNENPRPDHRHRLEHIAVSPSKGALERVKKLGVVISTQPLFIYYSGDSWLRLYGQERVQMTVPVKTPADMGIPVALGSDYPCSPDSRPQLTLWSAVTRKALSGEIIGPREGVDIRQALRLHTMGSAYAAHEEDMRGSIEVGKNADFVIWSDDFYTMPTDKIRDVKAELTIIEGQIVHKVSDTEIAAVSGSQYTKT